MFLWSVYCSHLVCGCVIESGPCLNKHQMWTQISCLLLYVLPVIYGKAPSCWSRCRAAVRPPLCRWYCLNCCAPYVIKTICPVFNYRTKTLYVTLNASFCLSIPWHYSHTQTFLYLKDRTTFFAGTPEQRAKKLHAERRSRWTNRSNTGLSLRRTAFVCCVKLK